MQTVKIATTKTLTNPLFFGYSFSSNPDYAYCGCPLSPLWFNSRVPQLIYPPRWIQHVRYSNTNTSISLLLNIFTGSSVTPSPTRTTFWLQAMDVKSSIARLARPIAIARPPTRRSTAALNPLTWKQTYVFRSGWFEGILLAQRHSRNCLMYIHLKIVVIRARHSLKTRKAVLLHLLTRSQA